MSDNAVKPWTDHDLLVCIMSIIEQFNVTLDLKGSKYPVGRNACGFRQKFNHLKRDLRPKLDAIVAGVPVDSATSATPKKATPKKSTAPKTSTPRKRKAADDGDEGEKATPRKRGRPKKVVEVEEEFVKAEVEEYDVKEKSESGDVD